MAFTSEHGESSYLLVAEQYLGKVFTDVILVLLVTSLFACILSFHNVVMFRIIGRKQERLPFPVSRNITT